MEALAATVHICDALTLLACLVVSIVLGFGLFDVAETLASEWRTARKRSRREREYRRLGRLTARERSTRRMNGERF